MRKIIITAFLLLFIWQLSGCSCDRTPPEPEIPGMYIYPGEINEGAEGLKNLELKVSLFPIRSKSIQVDYEVVPMDSVDLPALSIDLSQYVHEAIADEDYVALEKGTLTFEPGEFEQKIVIQVKGDVYYEREDLVFVKLSNAGTEIRQDISVGIIKNDDPPPVAKISSDGDARFAESSDITRTLNVELDLVSGIDTQLYFISPTESEFSNREGIAIYRSDYTIFDAANTQLYSNTSFIIPAFKQSASFTFQVIDDGVEEAEEGVKIGLGAGSLSKDDVIIHATDKEVLFTITETPETGTGIVALNDTGVTKAVSLGNTVLQDQLDHKFGRDMDYPDDTNGVSGFHFTKLDAQGVTIDQATIWSDDDVSKQWQCVRDEVTGLSWQVKKKKTQEGEVYQNYLNYVWWFDHDPNSNGGVAGKLESEDCERAKNCNTTYIAAQANLNKLCGKTGWRVPTIEELRTLVRYASHEDPTGGKYALDPNFFPDDRADLRYWSSTTSATNDKGAYVLKFGEGVDETVELKERSVNVVRLVNDQ